MLMMRAEGSMPVPIVACSTDDFGDQVIAVSSVVEGRSVFQIEISDGTWWHLFDLDQHIIACREVAP